MPVTDDQVAVLRAYLADDMDEHRQLYARLDRETARIGYVALVTAAFITAASQRFAQESTADVIGFVADLRSRSPALAESIDPGAAEHLIYAVLDDEDTDLDSKDMGGLMIVLLAGLVADRQPSPDELDEFLAGVRKLADRWLQ